MEAAGTLREETDEELAQIVSPEPKRPLLQPLPPVPSFTASHPPTSIPSPRPPPSSREPSLPTVLTICQEDTPSSDNSFATDDTNVSTITVNDVTDTTSNVTLVSVGMDVSTVYSTVGELNTAVGLKR